jgi:fructokinase
MTPLIGVGELLWVVFPDGRAVAGGAPFNFAVHCHQLGRDAAVVSRVGADPLGAALRAEVRRLGLSDAPIQTDDLKPTGTVTVTLDAAGVPGYVIAPDVAWDYLGWGRELEELAERAAVVCHGTLALRSPTTRATVELIAEENRKSILPSVRLLDVNLRNPRPEKELLRDAIASAEWVKVNAEELAELAGLFGTTAEDLIRTHRQDAAHESVWLITHGPDGAEVVTPRERHRVPGVPARVADTVGAGDAFTAAATVARLDGQPWLDCVRFAVRYAARVCEFPGATPRIDRDEIARMG